jgi:hypothetical protein
MQGGTPPDEYVELVLMERFNLKPWEVEEHMTVGRYADLLACLQGEARAERVRKSMGA